MTFARPYMQSHSVTPRQLLDEGIVEIGRVGSVAYALTKAKLRLFHADSIPRLDTPDTRVPEGLVVVGVDWE